MRKILNFGHTFAHAYEASLNYSKKLNHGEAVILGMKTALSFSLSLKTLEKRDYNLILNHVSLGKIFIARAQNAYFSSKIPKNYLCLIFTRVT